jgi:hypothetical protein
MCRVAAGVALRHTSRCVRIPSMDDERVRTLYREPPEAFVASRDALVRELKEAGQAEDAAAIKALRKPTVPAWAVNQLADRDPTGIGELLDAGAEVRAAQQAAMSSQANADRLRDATAARRNVLGRLARAAIEALRETGRSPSAHEEEIRGTLEAASVDPEASERLRAGTLERAIQGSGGFGDMFALRLVPEGDRASLGVAAKEASVSTAESGRRRRDAAAADRKAKRARETADRLAGQIQEMEARLEELAAKHAAAESSALEAETKSKRAGDALRKSGG